jgi:hypothetical protein
MKKSQIITVLICIVSCIIFGILTLNSADRVYNEKTEQLRNQNESLAIKNKGYKSEINELRTEYYAISYENSFLRDSIWAITRDYANDTIILNIKSSDTTLFIPTNYYRIKFTGKRKPMKIVGYVYEEDGNTKKITLE